MSKTTKTQLVINTMKRGRYNDLCALGQIQYDQLYLVEDDVLDAFGKQVVNVATPLSATDGVNKSYVDTNFINNLSIKDYIDNTKLYSIKSSSTYPLGSQYVNSSLEVFEKQEDPKWNIVVNKPTTLSPSDITITYSGDEFGWKFSFNGTYEYGTNKTPLADVTEVHNLNYDIIATRIWPKIDSYMSKKLIYSKLSSITKDSSQVEIATAIENLNAILSAYDR